MNSKLRKRGDSMNRAPGSSKTTDEDLDDVTRFALPQRHHQMRRMKPGQQAWGFEMERHLGTNTRTQKAPTPPISKVVSDVDVAACAMRVRESRRRNYATFEQLFKRHVAPERALPQDGKVLPHQVAPRLLSRARLDWPAGEMMKTLGVESFLCRDKKSSPIDTELPHIAESLESLSSRESLKSEDFSYYGVRLPEISDCAAKFKKGQRLRGWGKKKGKNK